eukprot:4136185-Prymnesium_polylepis.1
MKLSVSRVEVMLPSSVERSVSFPCHGVKEDGTKYCVYQAAGGQRRLKIGTGRAAKPVPLPRDDDRADAVERLVG